MVVVYLARLGLGFLEWLTDLLPTMPTWALPAAPAWVIPVPIFHSSAAALNTWAAASLATGVVLIVGRGLQWLYTQIPGKFT